MTEFPQLQMTLSLDYANYQVAWIAPLPIEAEAALGVLDRRHDGHFETTRTDNYDYIGGEIHGHNVVIATLPAGQLYGVGSAAALANQVKIRFTNSDSGEYRDIRLGNVLVAVPSRAGTGIVHYTLGRDTGSAFEITGRQAEISTRVRAAIGRIQRIHENPYKLGSLLANYLDEFQLMRYARGNRKFVRPSQDTDVLMSILTDDVTGAEIVHREPRDEEEQTQVFYGAIGSGDVLMRNPRRRDELRDQYNLIGLEMEAAGIVNALPTGVIRGVCDYGDGYKTKEWQPYAAAVAAVYARGILWSITPAAELKSIRVTRALPNVNAKELINSLLFEHIEDRYKNIKVAHFATCGWLLDNEQYQCWLDKRQQPDHHGVLWMKGKPGSGKSTLMKFALAEAEQWNREDIQIAFFFNARGALLERNSLGMFRSLLFQLLVKLPEAEEIISSYNILELPSAPRYDWTIPQLKDILHRALKQLRGRKLWIFVDALDECDEDQVRDMVEFFGLLGQQTMTLKENIGIVFASRYYPKITMRKMIELRLEEEGEHFRDIKRYVESELRIGEVRPVQRVQKIQEEIQRRASGIFIWVVLVVKLLNTAYDHGRTAGLEKKLQEIPDDLGRLFEGILNRDGQNLDSMRLCIQWILFARRPLTRQELYFAILSEADPDEVGPPDFWETTLGVMDAYILSCSKGLAEVTQGSNSTVQFIHETIRDFLLKGSGVQFVYGSSVASPHGLGHDILKRCCINYISSHEKILEQFTGVATLDDIVDLQKMHEHFLVAARDNSKLLRRRQQEVFSRLPFIEYAISQILFHADAAEFGKVSQASFIQTFDVRLWILRTNLMLIRDNQFEDRPNRWRHSSFIPLGSSLLYVLAELNLKSLIEVVLQVKPQTNIDEGYPSSPLLVALKLMRSEALHALLTPARNQNADHRSGVVLDSPTKPEIESLISTYFYCHELLSPAHSVLDFFFRWGVESDLVVLLRSRRFDLNAKISLTIPDNPLLFAASRGLQRLVMFLLGETHVSRDTRDEHGLSPIAKAAREGHSNTVVLLLTGAKKDSVNLQSVVGRSPLSYAAGNGHEEVSRLLSRWPAVDVNSRDKKGRTPLFHAAQSGREGVVKLLVETLNVDIVSRDSIGHTALSYAALHGHKGVVRQLLQTGKVDINSQDSIHGRTALSFAFEYGYESIAQLLLNSPGIDVNVRDRRGRIAAEYTPARGVDSKGMAELNLRNR